VYSSSAIAAAAAAFAYRFSRTVARHSLPSEKEESWQSVSRFLVLETRVSLVTARRSIVGCSTGRVNFVPRKRRSVSRRSARGNSELRWITETACAR